MSTLKNIISRAKNYYFKQWRGQEKICPAFNEKVYLTRRAWNHIAHHPRRNLVDKIIRLKKLPLAREIIEKSTTYQSCLKRKNIYYYGFQAIKNDIRIKVVVTSKGKNGRKILYSVMFKNIAKSEQKKIERHNAKLIREFRKNHPKRNKGTKK